MVFLWFSIPPTTFLFVLKDHVQPKPGDPPWPEEPPSLAPAAGFGPGGCHGGRGGVSGGGMGFVAGNFWKTRGFRSINVGIAMS